MHLMHRRAKPLSLVALTPGYCATNLDVRHDLLNRERSDKQRIEDQPGCFAGLVWAGAVFGEPSGEHLICP
jgi:hypothetical protein